MFKANRLAGEEAVVNCFMVLYRHLPVIFGQSIKNLSAMTKNGTDYIQNYPSLVTAELTIRFVFSLAVLRQGMEGEEGADVNRGIRSKDFSYRSVLVISSVHLQVMENPGLCGSFQFRIVPYGFEMNAEIRLQMGYTFFLTKSYLFAICRFSS
jgi:hypothetical protein